MPIPGVGPTGDVHCQGSVVMRFIVRMGPPSHGGQQARNGVGNWYRKCMGCGRMFEDEPLPTDSEMFK